MVARYSSPAGELLLGAYGGRLCICDWTSNHKRERIDRLLTLTLNAEYAYGHTEVTYKAAMQLDEYFEGRRRSFDIDLLLTGTPFRRRVWQQLMHIPYGSTISYAEEARLIGNPKAVRAAATANAVNPISIFVPCHRVIGSGGSLTGYGGGIEAKRYLLHLENTVVHTR
ncbi:MAG: methylated-DNA--[protein]-cysteine S-methyltransferase [Bacteroides sp.]|nr:methylated-DNA--[protein]-cysteine S-methyltransferase [Bacteroides sp.]